MLQSRSRMHHGYQRLKHCGEVIKKKALVGENESIASYTA